MSDTNGRCTLIPTTTAPALCDQYQESTVQFSTVVCCARTVLVSGRREPLVHNPYCCIGVYYCGDITAVWPG